MQSIPSQALNLLGDPKINERIRTTLAVRSITKSADGSKLEFELRDAILLARGSAVGALVITAENHGIAEGVASSQPDNAGNSPPAKHAPSFGEESGVSRFLKECKNERLPSHAVELARRFLGEIETFSNYDLIEGQARKWVTAPKNFLAITIQNKKQQFAIHVRETEGLDERQSLDVRKDRPGYARFWLKSEEQLSDAVLAVRASHERAMLRGNK